MMKAVMNPVETQQTACLIFLLHQQYYALTIQQVVEVAAMVELVATPGTDEIFLGAANRHGEVLPMLDLRPIFRQPAAPIDMATLFIVAQVDGQQVGLVVDEVQRIEYFESGQIRPASSREVLVQGMVPYGENLIQIIALASLLELYLPRAVLATFEGE